MKTEIDNFIGIFDNAVTDTDCDSLIDFFEQMKTIGNPECIGKPVGFSPNMRNNSMYFFMNENDPVIISQHQKQLYPFTDAIRKCYELYTEKYFTIEDLGRRVLNNDIKIQKTVPGEGYHIWHCEVASISTGRRFLLCMLYLNDIDEGGETEFIYQHQRIDAVKGRVVICPTVFTHTHRGNPPLNTAKYMINGWMEFIDL
tara:strand:- start:46 stop:645 length:600 start_codon:yes stop_codon:yes gene_type:complete